MNQDNKKKKKKAKYKSADYGSFSSIDPLTRRK